MRPETLAGMLIIIGSLASAGMILSYTGYFAAIDSVDVTAESRVISSPTLLPTPPVQKIPIVISVSSFLSDSLSNVSVYCDESLKGVTDSNGILIFEDFPGTHYFTLEGSGFIKKEITYVDKKENTLKYRVERKFPLTIKVIDIYLGGLIQNASIEIDDHSKGLTDKNGTLTAPEVAEGWHEIKVTYNGFSEEKPIYLTENEKVFDIEMIYMPEKTSIFSI